MGTKRHAMQQSLSHALTCILWVGYWSPSFVSTFPAIPLT